MIDAYYWIRQCHFAPSDSTTANQNSFSVVFLTHPTAIVTRRALQVLFCEKMWCQKHLRFANFKTVSAVWTNNVLIFCYITNSQQPNKYYNQEQYYCGERSNIVVTHLLICTILFLFGVFQTPWQRYILLSDFGFCSPDSKILFPQTICPFLWLEAPAWLFLLQPPA